MICLEKKESFENKTNTSKTENKMLEFLAVQTCQKPVEQSKGEKTLQLILYLVLLAVAVAAIVDASYKKKISSTFQADIVVSILSPFLYWVLRAFGVLGEA